MISVVESILDLACSISEHSGKPDLKILVDASTYNQLILHFKKMDPSRDWADGVHTLQINTADVGIQIERLPNV